MPPRTMPLPTAQTDSARELRRAFFCELCQKGYARINELEAHENSYDHQHKKRLKDMKAMTRQPPTGAKRKAEKSDMISVNLKSAPPKVSVASTNRPVGWPAAPAASATASSADVMDWRHEKDEAPLREQYGDESQPEERPLAWEELGEIHELMDLDAQRPRTLQKIVDSQVEWVARRKDEATFEDLMRRVAAMKG